MRVVFIEDVQGVALGGEVKEVKNGFARNYLIPQKLAVPATPGALQRIRGLKKTAGETRLKKLADLRELAELLEGVQVQIEMRASTEGSLYGSVTSAIVARELSAMTDREIERRVVGIGEPIRKIGFSDVKLKLDEDIEATITVLVYPEGTDPADMSRPEEGDTEDETEPEADVDSTQIEAEPPVEDSAEDSDVEQQSDDESKPEEKA